MTPDRLEQIAAGYQRLRIAVVGDYCLDRYLEIDPARSEISIETGLPVHNVVNVRAQPGGSGTIVNNLAALGIGTIIPVGFCGDDGEGFELQRTLAQVPGVRMDHFFATRERRTFTYCKPLLMHQGAEPEELSRLDSKNWAETPGALSEQLAAAVRTIGGEVDAVIALEQVDLANTGVITREVLAVLGEVAAKLPVVADSRRGLAHFPPMIFKLNAAEFCRMTGLPLTSDPAMLGKAAARLAAQNSTPVIVTLAANGMLGATPDGAVHHEPALPLRGPIDVVGAGDSVTANLTAALANGSSLNEALRLATRAASVVIHKVGTTGTASLAEIAALN